MIDEYLADVRESVSQQFLNIIENDSQVSKAMLHTVLAPSKCIRAGIVRAAAELEGTLKKESINNLETAVEAMHSYSLIHDDLPAMDDDDMRRGQACIAWLMKLLQMMLTYLVSKKLTSLNYFQIVAVLMA